MVSGWKIIVDYNQITSIKVKKVNDFELDTSLLRPEKNEHN